MTSKQSTVTEVSGVNGPGTGTFFHHGSQEHGSSTETIPQCLRDSSCIATTNSSSFTQTQFVSHCQQSTWTTISIQGARARQSRRRKRKNQPMSENEGRTSSQRRLHSGTTPPLWQSSTSLLTLLTRSCGRLRKATMICVLTPRLHASSTRQEFMRWN